MIPQSLEWHEFRLGKFTASEIYKLMGERGGIGTDTAQTYIKEKVAEELSRWWDSYENAEMRWGTETEPYAREYYEVAFDCKVGMSDPITADWCSEASCSPDGLIIGQEKGIEIKCPAYPHNHVTHMLVKSAADLKKISKKYYWQIQMNMLVMDYPVWDFVSFDPRFTGRNRMYVIEIPRNEDDCVLLKANILAAVELKHEMIKTINQ